MKASNYDRESHFESQFDEYKTIQPQKNDNLTKGSEMSD